MDALNTRGNKLPRAKMAHECHAERMPMAEARRYVSYVSPVRIRVTNSHERHIDDVQEAQNEEILVDIQAAEFRSEQNNHGYSIAEKTNDEQKESEIQVDI